MTETPTPFRSPLDLLANRSDLLREDNPTLFPLLELLDPPEGDATTQLARRLLDLLGQVDTTLDAQVLTFEALTARLDAVDARLTMLLGEPD